LPKIEGSLQVYALLEHNI